MKFFQYILNFLGFRKKSPVEKGILGDIISERTNNTKITSFGFSNENNEQLHFELIPSITNIQNWNSVELKDNDLKNINGFVSNIISSSATVGIASQATNGLFKASTNSELLMKLKDGGLGSAVMNGNKITGSAGFLEVGSTFFTPLICFQVLSLAVGQTYMKNISLQLNSIQEKLNTIIRLHHLNREVIMKVEYDELQKLALKNKYDSNDFSIINRATYELSKIKLEYFTLANETYQKVKLEKANWKLNSKKSAIKTIKSFKESGFIYNIENAILSQNLFKLAKLIEFQMKLSKNDLTFNNMAEIRKLNESEFENRTLKLYAELNDKYLENLKQHKEKAKWNNEDLSTIIENELKSIKIFDSELKKRNHLIDSNYKQLTDSFISDRGIVLDFRNEKTKLYIN